MKLITKKIENIVPLLGTQGAKGDNAIAYAHFFNPSGSGDWYMTEYDPNERIGFGLCHIFEAEFGYFCLEEMENVTNQFGLGIERDLYFKPKTLSEIKKEKGW